MNRTDTVKRLLSRLTKERTTAQLAKMLGCAHMTAYAALRRLEAKGKVTKRLDSDGVLWWAKVAQEQEAAARESLR